MVCMFTVHSFPTANPQAILSHCLVECEGGGKRVLETIGLR